MNSCTGAYHIVSADSQPRKYLDAGIITVNASTTLLYRDLQMAGIDQLNLYRAELNYSF